MKEVMAVIRMNKMNVTKKALTEAGVDAFYAFEAQGRGQGLVNHALMEGATQGYEEAAVMLGEKGRLYPKRVISIVVEDEDVDEVVATIITCNQAGKPGDGKIFIMPVADAIRVRTAETGDKAIS